MTPNHSPLLQTDPNENIDPNYSVERGPSSTAVTHEMRKFYASQAEKRKRDVDALAAEVHQRQDKMRLVNDIIAKINTLTKEDNSVDITQDPELVQLLQLARDNGVQIKEQQTSFNGLERDRLIENLHLAADSWDKENRSNTHRMEVIIKELDRLMMILKDIDRKENQAKHPMLAGIRGGS